MIPLGSMLGCNNPNLDTSIGIIEYGSSKNVSCIKIKRKMCTCDLIMVHGWQVFHPCKFEKLSKKIKFNNKRGARARGEAS